MASAVLPRPGAPATTATATAGLSRRSASDIAAHSASRFASRPVKSATSAGSWAGTRRSDDPAPSLRGTLPAGISPSCEAAAGVAGTAADGAAGTAADRTAGAARGRAVPPMGAAGGPGGRCGAANGRRGGSGDRAALLPGHGLCGEERLTQPLQFWKGIDAELI